MPMPWRFAGRRRLQIAAADRVKRGRRALPAARVGAHRRRATQLVASTRPEDEAPRRLKREEKPLFDLATCCAPPARRTSAKMWSRKKTIQIDGKGDERHHRDRALRRRWQFRRHRAGAHPRAGHALRRATAVPGAAAGSAAAPRWSWGSCFACSAERRFDVAPRPGRGCVSGAGHRFTSSSAWSGSPEPRPQPTVAMLPRVQSPSGAAMVAPVAPALVPRRPPTLGHRPLSASAAAIACRRHGVARVGGAENGFAHALPRRAACGPSTCSAGRAAVLHLRFCCAHGAPRCGNTRTPMPMWHRQCSACWCWCSSRSSTALRWPLPIPLCSTSLLPFPERWVGLDNFKAILGDFNFVRGTPKASSGNYQNFYWTLIITVIWTVSNVTIGVSLRLPAGAGAEYRGAERQGHLSRAADSALGDTELHHRAGLARHVPSAVRRHQPGPADVRHAAGRLVRRCGQFLPDRAGHQRLAEFPVHDGRDSRRAAVHSEGHVRGRRSRGREPLAAAPAASRCRC